MKLDFDENTRDCIMAIIFAFTVFLLLTSLFFYAGYLFAIS